MANPTSSTSIPSSIDPKSGFCTKTKVYHSLRQPAPLPSETDPLSLTTYIFSLLRQTSSTSPGNTAASLIDATNFSHIPYSEVELRVRNLAAYLRVRIKLSKGDSAFVLSPNSIHLPVLFLSLFALGVVVSPSNPASSEPEISRQIELCKPVIAFASSETAVKLPALKYGQIILDSPQFESMMTTGEDNFDPIDVSQSDTAAILYSSGTTGKIKGVALSHRNLTATIAGALSARPSRSSPVVILCTVPYFHVYGLMLCLRSVAFGDSVASMKKFEMKLMKRAIEELRVTHLAAAPPLVVAMACKDDIIKGCDYRSLEVVLCGGAQLTDAVIEKFNRRFPNVAVAQGYGLTEVTGGVSRTAGPDESKIVGHVGKLISNCQAKIVDPGTGIGLPPLKQGELWVKGPFIMEGYVEDEDATAAVMDSEGWFKTGDLCYIDSDGFLFYVERLKELIKYKGYQVPPAELEHILQSHPDIIEAAVIPYPDEEAGQVPMAYVVRRPESTIDGSQIKDFVAKQVAPYKKIRRVSFINSIPKNAPGKVLRKELVKLALSSATSKL